MPEPAFVHYLPIGTTIISAVFLGSLLSRAAKRNWPPHLVWWAIGVFFYGLGTAFESTITLAGNTETLNRLWYWAGAILGGYPLATGSLYLLHTRRLAHTLTAVSLAVVLIMSVLVFVAPIKEGVLQSHRPTGRKIYEWAWLPFGTVFINLYAMVFLVGGAVKSSVRFWLAGDQPKRAIGTALIAFGALLPAIGGALTKSHDLPEALYVGEILGIVLIWIGYEFCIRGPKPGHAADSPHPARGPEPA
jgi:hypothetical protein